MIRWTLAIVIALLRELVWTSVLLVWVIRRMLRRVVRVVVDWHRMLGVRRTDVSLRQLTASWSCDEWLWHERRPQCVEVGRQSDCFSFHCVL